MSFSVFGIATVFAFILGWVAVMAIIGFVCFAVSKWGKGKGDSSDRPVGDEAGRGEK